MKRILILTGMLLIGVVLSPVRRYVVGAFRPVEEQSVVQAAWAVASSDKQPVLLVLYDVENARDLFPQIVDLCDQAQDRGVRVLAYDVDEGLKTLLLGGFLDEHSASFEPRRIASANPGELSREFRSLGIIVEGSYSTPLIVVRDRKGEIVFQGQSVRSLEPVRASVELALKGQPDPQPHPARAKRKPPTS